jgi:hypothetical protein
MMTRKHMPQHRSRAVIISKHVTATRITECASTFYPEVYPCCLHSDHMLSSIYCPLLNYPYECIAPIFMVEEYGKEVNSLKITCLLGYNTV